MYFEIIGRTYVQSAFWQSLLAGEPECVRISLVLDFRSNGNLFNPELNLVQLNFSFFFLNDLFISKAPVLFVFLTLLLLVAIKLSEMLNSHPSEEGQMFCFTWLIQGSLRQVTLASSQSRHSRVCLFQVLSFLAQESFLIHCEDSVRCSFFHL